MKSRICALCSAVSLFLTGCSSEAVNDYRSVQRYSLLEIYSNSGELINSIDDENTLSQFNSLEYVNVSDDIYDMQKTLKEQADELPVLCTVVNYKIPASVINDGNLEKISEITIYENSNIIKEHIMSDNVKNISLPEDYLIFYYTASEEDIEFFKDLTESNIDTKEQN